MWLGFCAILSLVLFIIKCFAMKKWMFITACLFCCSAAVAQSAPKVISKTTEHKAKSKEAVTTSKDSMRTNAVKIPTLRFEADTVNNPKVRERKD